MKLTTEAKTAAFFLVSICTRKKESKTGGKSTLFTG